MAKISLDKASYNKKKIKQSDLCHVMLFLVHFQSSKTNWLEGTKISQRVQLKASTNV